MYQKTIPLFLSIAVLTACSSQVQAPLQNQSPDTISNIETPKAIVQSFADWKIQFSKRALAQGIASETVEHLLANAVENQKIISLDRKQPEFTKLPWIYVDSAVTTERIENGRDKYRANTSFLLDLEKHYGVPASVITAIWGIETGYGSITGKTDLGSALSTLAYEGRRRDFAEQQLIALLQLLENGDVPWTTIQGSWAGGMGQTQFIPTTWQRYGVDGNHDGKRNPWTQADALSATAKYLSASGWQRNLPWGYEVQLPASFDYAYVGQTLPLTDWSKLGLVSVKDVNLNRPEQATLWLPGGHQGPALLTTKNFDVIRVYNNASSYALAVSLLADGISGRGGLQKDWPRHEKPISTANVHLLQERLTKAGFDTRGTDGILGKNTRTAFRKWQLAEGEIADGFVSQDSAKRLLY